MSYALFVAGGPGPSVFIRKLNMYQKLDDAILKALNNYRNPLYNAGVSREARLIIDGTDRKEFRVIDGRLQFLRKQGHIKHTHETKSSGGWVIINLSRLR